MRSFLLTRLEEAAHYPHLDSSFKIDKSPNPFALSVLWSVAEKNVSKGNPMNNFYVYILKCNDDSYYIGHTDDIEERIAEHRLNAYECYTSTRLPVTLVYMQIFGSRGEALDSERQLKKWNRKKKEVLIEENWSRVSLLAKKRFDEK